MILEVEALGKRYEPPPRWLRPLIRTATSTTVEALRDITFGVDRGEVVGLVGPNGAGKTTLIKILATLLLPSSGAARVDGVDVALDPASVRRRIGLVLTDERSLYWRLTGRQNLNFFGVLAGLPRATAERRTDELLERLELADRDKLVLGYSAGMRARLNLGRALMARPPLLILDEPTRSLDPLATVAVGEILREEAAQGTAVLLSSHSLEEITAVCDRIVVVVHGQTRFNGTLSELDSSSNVGSAIIDLLRRDAEPEPV